MKLCVCVPVDCPPSTLDLNPPQTPELFLFQAEVFRSKIAEIASSAGWCEHTGQEFSVARDALTDAHVLFGRPPA
jgi:hypothetical protein